MSFTKKQLDYIRAGFEECLIHWCHPDGDDADLYLDEDEYAERAQEYYIEITKNHEMFSKDWDEIIRLSILSFEEKFIGCTLTKDQARLFLIEALDYHLNY